MHIKLLPVKAVFRLSFEIPTACVEGLDYYIIEPAVQTLLSMEGLFASIC